MTKVEVAVCGVTDIPQSIGQLKVRTLLILPEFLRNAKADG
jgi:hypothetical protein